jgi:hypoxanthine phosphoribosyltransferase
LADLIRELTNPVQIDFIQVASYGAETTSTGQVKIKKNIEMDIRDRHVIIVEDIVDSGLTIAYLLECLEQLKPASVKVCAFINKMERREREVRIDYVGHTVEAGFLVGYGLDLNERYRDLPGLYHLKT